MTTPKSITGATTLGELRDQLLLFNVIAVRIFPSLEGVSEDLLDASLHHSTGFYIGAGVTPAEALEAAFRKLRQAVQVDSK
jgi:hypothetical protein